MTEKRNHTRLFTILSMPPMVVAGMGVVIAILLFVYPAGLKYSSDQYEPVLSVLCPGEMLETTIAYQIRRAPVSALLIRVWWSVGRQDVVYTEPEKWFIWMRDLPMTEHTLSITVPELMPGPYQFTELRLQFRDIPSPAYTISFTVPEDCPHE